MNEKVYKVLNPVSWFAPFDAVPLNLRLDNLEGKVICIVGQTHEPMLYLKDALKAALPGIKDIIILDKKDKYGDRGGIGKELQQKIKGLGIDAAIQGIAH